MESWKLIIAGLILMSGSYYIGRKDSAAEIADYKGRVKTYETVIEMDRRNDSLMSEINRISQERTVLRIEKMIGYRLADSLYKNLQDIVIDTNKVRTSDEANNAILNRIRSDGEPAENE